MIKVDSIKYKIQDKNETDFYVNLFVYYQNNDDNFSNIKKMIESNDVLKEMLFGRYDLCESKLKFSFYMPKNAKDEFLEAIKTNNKTILLLHNQSEYASFKFIVSLLLSWFDLSEMTNFGGS